MRASCCFTALVLLIAAPSQAQVSDRLAFEGLLAHHDGHPVADGLYQVTFRLHDVDRGGAVTWQEAQAVLVEGSRFTAELGVVARLEVSSGRSYRLSAEGFGADGVPVTLAGDDGVLILKAGTPSEMIGNILSNGVEVQGAQGYGLFVGRADAGGVVVISAGGDGVRVITAEGDGVLVAVAEDDGIDINYAGDIGIEVSGTTHEAAYFQRSIDGFATRRNHVVLIENTASTTTNGPDVLALQSKADPATGNTNFITFFNGNGTAVGAVEGNAGGTGVAYKTSGADVAEYLPRLHEEETLEAGDLVGVFAGHVTKATHGADQVMVVTGRAALLGNMPAEEEAAHYEAVAFVGQVAVRVAGPVEAGDLLVASGREDGTARGVSMAAYRPEDGPVLGRALASSTGDEVLALVGVDEASSLRQVVARQQDQIEALGRELAELRSLIQGSVSEARR